MLSVSSHLDCYEKCDLHAADLNAKCRSFMFDRYSGICTIFMIQAPEYFEVSDGKDLYVYQRSAKGMFCS